ncbi:MAG TPA: FAD-binding oxidoreductase [Burkholderiales bacterium]|nr:FAD-binding oxidoreductase [Burkholderiales bacterium]
MPARKLKIVGWGYEGEEISAEERAMIARRLAGRFKGEFDLRRAPSEESIELHAPRLALPAGLKAFATSDKRDRLVHTYGKSFPDYARIFERDFAHAPDIVAFARSEADIEAVYEYAAGANVAVIPFGGGTSVCGGVEPAVGDGYNGSVSLDLTGLDRIVEIDRTSRAARIQGGIRVPEMEAQLKRHGLTMRHFPQSMELATLGGMIATRSGGHFATLYTHIDDFVESVRSVTPAGTMESRRLPGSGAGPSPDRLMIGSEGALGIITEAWMRLQDRPTHRAGTAVMFDDVYQAVEAVRIICQAGLYPANVRLLDAREAQFNGFGDGKQSVVVLAFENADHPVQHWMNRALEICRAYGGRSDEAGAGSEDGHRAGAAGAWRHAFIRMPYYMKTMVEMGVITDTFETAITWERFRALYEAVVAATEAAALEVTGQPGSVSCRFTHCYPDGPAPYFSFQAKGRQGALAEQWLQIKSKALDAVIAHGGTVTHHHAVGRDHMRWYQRQRPELFGAALAAVKGRFDPRGILNPGVLLPARR